MGDCFGTYDQSGGIQTGNGKRTYGIDPEYRWTRIPEVHANTDFDGRTTIPAIVF